MHGEKTSHSNHVWKKHPKMWFVPRVFVAIGKFGRIYYVVFLCFDLNLMGFDITSKFVYHKAVISVDVFCRFKISCQSLIFCTSKFVTHFVDLCTCTFFCRSKLYGAFRLDPNSSQFFFASCFSLHLVG
jgi:hypothetical protein